MKESIVKGEFRFSPLTIPLKTTKKGAAAPFLGFSPEFGLCGDRLRLAKRATDASLIDRRGSRNTMRLFPLQLERQFVCVRCAMQPLQERRPFDFHTSNIQRAQTKRRARCIVRLGNPIGRPPEGRSLRNVLSVNGTQNQNAFSARQRYFASPAVFSSISFLPRQKRYSPRSGGDGAPNQTAPPAHTNAPPEASGATEIKKPHIRADKRGRRRNNEKVLW